MSEIINFKQQRKAKARADKEKLADANRRKFGRTKGEKKKEELEASKLEKHLDGHKKDDEDGAE